MISIKSHTAYLTKAGYAIILLFMDTEALQARSVELAERAYRLMGQGDNKDLKLKLDKVGDTLIKVDDENRFYLAQSILEEDATWTEATRALAHEINTADHQLKNINTLNLEAALKFLVQWTNQYMSSSNPNTRQTGAKIESALQMLILEEPKATQKESIGYLISFLETILSQIGTGVSQDKLNSSVLIIRNVRDALLSARVLLIDKNELMEKNDQENQEVDRVEVTRESLDEIYATITPVVSPSQDDTADQTDG